MYLYSCVWVGGGVTVSDTNTLSRGLRSCAHMISLPPMPSSDSPCDSASALRAYMVDFGPLKHAYAPLKQGLPGLLARSTDPHQLVLECVALLLSVDDSHRQFRAGAAYCSLLLDSVGHCSGFRIGQTTIEVGRETISSKEGVHCG